MFAYFVSIFGPMLCDGRSHPFHRDNSHCLSLALQVPWLMDAILALAIHHYALSQKESSASALRHYGQAVKGLRESVPCMTSPEDVVLCTVTFAGLFEERLSDHRDSFMVHFYSSCNFLRALTPTLEANRGSNGRMAFLRQQADLAIYHIATRAIFEQDTQKLLEHHYLEGLEAYLQKVHPGPQDIDPFPSSSFLGPVPELYTLVYQITLLARKTPLGIFEMAQAQAHFKRIIEIKALFDATSFLHFAGKGVANPFLAEDCTPRLYMLALEIMLTKIMKPETTAANLDIQNRVHEAYSLLSRRSFIFAHDTETHGDMSYHLSEPLCWPLLVIGAAVLRTEHRDAFEKVLEDLWYISYNGFVRRVSAILKMVWSADGGRVGNLEATDSSMANNQVIDHPDSSIGFDVLLRQNGLS